MATLNSEPEITETVSPRDVTIGFLAMFRQCHVSQEGASFKRAYDLAGRELRLHGRDTEGLRVWRRAQATLQQTYIDHLILDQAARDGHVPQHLTENNAFRPSGIDSPEQMISALFYGDSIHWGDRRTVIEAWNRDRVVFAAKGRFDALRGAIHLGRPIRWLRLGGGVVDRCLRVRLRA